MLQVQANSQWFNSPKFLVRWLSPCWLRWLTKNSHPMWSTSIVLWALVSTMAARLVEEEVSYQLLVQRNESLSQNRISVTRCQWSLAAVTGYIGLCMTSWKNKLINELVQIQEAKCIFSFQKLPRTGANVVLAMQLFASMRVRNSFWRAWLYVFGASFGVVVLLEVDLPWPLNTIEYPNLLAELITQLLADVAINQEDSKQQHPLAHRCHPWNMFKELLPSVVCEGGSHVTWSPSTASWMFLTQLTSGVLHWTSCNVLHCCAPDSTKSAPFPREGCGMGSRRKEFLYRTPWWKIGEDRGPVLNDEALVVGASKLQGSWLIKLACGSNTALKQMRWGFNSGISACSTAWCFGWI